MNFRRIVYLIVIMTLFFYSKIKAQSVKWLTVYNNKYVNLELFKNDTINAKELNSGEGLVLYKNNLSDTVMYNQNLNEYQKNCATYLKWDKNDKLPTYKGSKVIMKDSYRKQWVNYYPDHCSHYSHYSQSR